jgi:hypothetical protein
MPVRSAIQRRADAVAGRVRQKQDRAVGPVVRDDPVARQADHVVRVAARLVGGLTGRGQVEPLQLRQPVRPRVLLDLPRQLHVPLQLEQRPQRAAHLLLRRREAPHLLDVRRDRFSLLEVPAADAVAALDQRLDGAAEAARQQERLRDGERQDGQRDAHDPRAQLLHVAEQVRHRHEDGDAQPAVPRQAKLPRLAEPRRAAALELPRPVRRLGRRRTDRVRDLGHAQPVGRLQDGALPRAGILEPAVLRQADHLAVVGQDADLAVLADEQAARESRDVVQHHVEADHADVSPAGVERDRRGDAGVLGREEGVGRRPVELARLRDRLPEPRPLARVVVQVLPAGDGLRPVLAPLQDPAVLAPLVAPRLAVDPTVPDAQEHELPPAVVRHHERGDLGVLAQDGLEGLAQVVGPAGVEPARVAPGLGHPDHVRRRPEEPLEADLHLVEALVEQRAGERLDHLACAQDGRQQDRAAQEQNDHEQAGQQAGANRNRALQDHATAATVPYGMSKAA